MAHPGLLWTGLALASVPILIHLFFRRRHRVVRWAAMDWLLAALRKQKRRMQVENLILLILRCLLIALLAAAIARPSVQAAALNPFGGGTRSMVLVVDTSASMGAQHTGRRTLERAKERAGEILNDLGSDSKVTLVATRDDVTGGAPRALLENASPSDVRRRLGSLQLSNGPNRLGEVFRLVGRRLERLAGRKLVLFVTDLQRRDWRQANGTRHEDVYRALRNLRRETDKEPPPVTILDVGVADAANVAIEDFRVEQGREAFAGFMVGLSVDLVNYGPRPVDGTLTLFMTGAEGKREKKGAKRVTIPATTGALGHKVKKVPLHQYLRPGSEGPARFEIVFTPSAGQDRLAGDSRRFLSLIVKPPVRLLPVQTHRNALDVLRDVDVLDVIDMGEPVDPIALSTRNLDDIDAIVWADADPHGLEDTGMKRLEQFVRRGGGLVAYLGKNAFPSQINGTSRAPRFFRERGEGLFPMLLEDGPMFDAQDQPVEMDYKSAGNSPLFLEAAFAGSPEYLGYRRVKDCPKEKIVARYDDGSPAVIEHTFGRGRVLIVTTTPDERAFRLNGSLLPVVFLFNAAHYLVAEDPTLRNVLVGRPVRIVLPEGARQVTVEPPENAGGRTQEPVNDASKPFVLNETIYPGFYRITVKGVAASGASSLPIEEVHFAAVNLDTVESDLRRIPAKELTSAYQGTGLRTTTDAAEILPRATAGEDEGELSRSLLMAVVALLLIELLVAWRFGTRRRPT